MGAGGNRFCLGSGSKPVLAPACGEPLRWPDLTIRPSGGLDWRGGTSTHQVRSSPAFIQVRQGADERKRPRGDLIA